VFLASRTAAARRPASLNKTSKGIVHTDRAKTKGVSTRSFRAVVRGSSGVDWDRLQEFEDFCRANISNLKEPAAVIVNLADGSLMVNSVAEARNHEGSLDTTDWAVVVRFSEPLWPPQYTYADAYMSVSDRASLYEFTGLNEAEVEGLAAGWQKRLAKAAPTIEPKLTSSSSQSQPLLISGTQDQRVLVPEVTSTTPPEQSLLLRTINNRWVVGIITGILVTILLALAVLVTHAV